MKTPLKQLRSDLAARLKAVRWGVVVSRASVVAGTVSGWGVYAHCLPVRYAVPFSTACLIAAGLCPRLQKAAGIVQSVQDGQTTLVQGVAQAWGVFVTAREEQALLKKAQDLAPVLEEIERRKTVQGNGPTSAELSAAHQAIDAVQTLAAAQAPDGAAPAPPPVPATPLTDQGSIDATGGNQ